MGGGGGGGGGGGQYILSFVIITNALSNLYHKDEEFMKTIAKYGHSKSTERFHALKRGHALQRLINFRYGPE